MITFENRAVAVAVADMKQHGWLKFPADQEDRRVIAVAHATHARGQG